MKFPNPILGFGVLLSLAASASAAGKPDCDTELQLMRKRLESAVDAAEIARVTLSSGVAINGKLAKVRLTDEGSAAYLHFSGPTFLSVKKQTLPGQDIKRHPQGFGAPVGKLSDGKDLYSLTEAELKARGWNLGGRITIDYQSGVHIEAILTSVNRTEKGKIILLQLDDCKITSGTETLYQPAWGQFDLAVGASVTGVDRSLPATPGTIKEANKTLCSDEEAVRSILDDYANAIGEVPNVLGNYVDLLTKKKSPLGVECFAIALFIEDKWGAVKAAKAVIGETLGGALVTYEKTKPFEAQLK